VAVDQMAEPAGDRFPCEQAFVHGTGGAAVRGPRVYQLTHDVDDNQR